MRKFQKWALQGLPAPSASSVHLFGQNQTVRSGFTYMYSCNCLNMVHISSSGDEGKMTNRFNKKHIHV